MASPFTYASPANLAYGPGAASDYLGGLANAQAHVIDFVDNSAGSMADVLYQAIQMAVAGASGGTMTLYAIWSNDNITWTDGVLSSDITGGVNVQSKIITAPTAGLIIAASPTNFWFPPFSLTTALGTPEMPPYAGVIALNNSGGAVAATSGSNNTAKKTVITFA